MDQNAKKALKQMKMEVAADYGMHYEDAFEIIERAHSNRVLSSHLKNVQSRKTLDMDKRNDFE